MKKRALIYHTAISKNSTSDDLDVLEQSKFVSKILKKLGYEVEQKPFEVDFLKDKKHLETTKIKEEIKRINPLFVFNLVESIRESDSLAFWAPQIFEENSIPYTGCTKDSIFKTRTKIETKKILEKNGILTPYWLTLKDLPKKTLLNKKYIMKFNINHASKNLGNTLLETRESIKEELEPKGEDFFVEEYIDGREFNISMIGSVGNVKILPFAEMKFVDWPINRLKVMGYSAKWNSNSGEYKRTQRTFKFSDSDKSLLKKIKGICKKCWNIFGLRGYARIDFRVTKEKIPYVLEINANPCISPDAGFIKAAYKAGMDNEKIIKEIIKNSCGEKFV